MPGYELDDLDSDDCAVSEPVNIFDFLSVRGFSDEAAANITLHALLTYGMLPPELICAAAAALGFGVPDLTSPLSTPSIKDRN